MSAWVPTVAKAVAGGATAFGATFTTAWIDEAVSTGEWVAIAVSTVVACAVVWAVPNRQA